MNIEGKKRIMRMLQNVDFLCRCRFFIECRSFMEVIYCIILVYISKHYLCRSCATCFICYILILCVMFYCFFIKSIWKIDLKNWRKLWKERKEFLNNFSMQLKDSFIYLYLIFIYFIYSCISLRILSEFK